MPLPLPLPLTLTLLDQWRRCEVVEALEQLQVRVRVRVRVKGELIKG